MQISSVSPLNFKGRIIGIKGKDDANESLKKDPIARRLLNQVKRTVERSTPEAYKGYIEISPDFGRERYNLSMISANNKESAPKDIGFIPINTTDYNFWLRNIDAFTTLYLKK